MALREGHGGDRVPAVPCPSFLSLLVPRAGMAAAKRGWRAQSRAGCAVGHSEPVWAVLSFLRLSLRPWGGHQCFGRFFLFWAFPIISIIICFRCRGGEGSVSIFVTGAPSHGVFQAVCHDISHGCRRKCPVREGSFCIGDYKGGSFPCWSSGAGPCRGWNINQKSPERSSFPAELMSQQGITSMPWPWGSWDRSCGTALGLLPHPELPPTQTLPWFHNELLWCSSSSHSPGSAWNGCPVEAGGSGSFSGLVCGVGETFSVGCSLQLQNSLGPLAVWAAQAALACE